MNNHQNQAAALTAAAQLVRDLPHGTRFGIEVTDYDSWEDPSVMNIYAKSHNDMLYLTSLLNLKQLAVADRAETFVSYRLGALLVSLVEPEENA